MAQPKFKLPIVNIAKAQTDEKKEEGLQYVVAVDESFCAKHAFRWARFLANPKDQVTIVHSMATKDSVACVQQRYGKYPKEDAKKYTLRILGQDADNEEEQALSVEERIKHYVNKGQQQTVDILVTGLYGATYEQNGNKNKKGCKNIVGSTSDLSLRAARCSSFFVRREVDIPEDQSKLRICVGVDGSQNSEHAFATAVRLLAPNNTLFVAHVTTEYTNADVPKEYWSVNVIKKYTQRIEESRKALGFEVTIKMESIEAVKISDGLCKFAEEKKCDILCVGADGMTAHCNNKPILGSVSDECVKDCQCNIIVTQINEYCSTPRGGFQRTFYKEQK